MTPSQWRERRSASRSSRPLKASAAGHWRSSRSAEGAPARKRPAGAGNAPGATRARALIADLTFAASLAGGDDVDVDSGAGGASRRVRRQRAPAQSPSAARVGGREGPRGASDAEGAARAREDFHPVQPGAEENVGDGIGDVMPANAALPVCAVDGANRSVGDAQARGPKPRQHIVWVAVAGKHSVQIDGGERCPGDGRVAALRVEDVRVAARDGGWRARGGRCRRSGRGA